MKKFLFENGTLEVAEEQLIYSGGKYGRQTIPRTQYSGTNYKQIRILPKQDIVYGFRFFVGAILLYLISLKLPGSVQPFIEKICTYILIASVITIFGSLILDGLLGMGIINSILLGIFGQDHLTVTIQGSNGNKIEFVTLPEDRRKVRELIDYLTPPKSSSGTNPTANTAQAV